MNPLSEYVYRWFQDFEQAFEGDVQSPEIQLMDDDEQLFRVIAYTKKKEPVCIDIYVKVKTPFDNPQYVIKAIPWNNPEKVIQAKGLTIGKTFKQIRIQLN